MPKFCKLPVVIDAVMFDGKIQSIDGFMPYSDFEYRPGYRMPAGQAQPSATIKTLEGDMTAQVGDYIIKGVNGEFYPCKPGIFNKTYEKVNEPACTAPQDPDHQLTDDEIKRLNETGSLCDCADLPRNIFQQEFIPKERDDSDIKFDFGIAIRKLKEGKKVARKGWNGSGMFVYYVPAASYPMQRNNNQTLKGIFPNDMVPYQHYLALKTAQGTISTWAPSVSDSLADDWMLV